MATSTIDTSTGYKLLNPLDKFVSYSTHFVILAARTTERAKIFTKADAVSARATLDAIDRTTALGDPVSIDGSEDVYLVMDTRRFSQFSVQSMKYEVLINGLQAGASHSNLATTIEMTILDSVGISFINFMQWLMDSKMQTNFDGMLFMIRTIFVGHNEDGSSETVQSVTIPAHLFKMEVNLDFAKGIYNLEFMPNMNFDVNTHSRWLNIGTATSYFTGEGDNTLGAMVDGFEARVNAASVKYYESIAPEIVTSRGVQTPSGPKFGRLVKYQITIPDDWRKMPFTGASSNSKEERNFKEELQKAETAATQQADGKGIPAKDSHMSTQWGLKITDVLDLMFKQVSDIQHLANADKIKRTDEVVSFYKHVIGITSTDDTVTVHVDVVPFNVPRAKPSNEKDAANVSKNDEFYVNIETPNGTKRLPKTFFELDYIFTGQNTDVLNFDMKIQDLQFLLAANTRVSEGEVINQIVLGEAGPDENAKKTQEPEVMRARAYDPMLIPLINDGKGKAMSQFVKVRNQALEKDIYRSSQEYAQNLSAFYALSPITTSVTIKGNPEIMAHFNVGTLLPDVSTATTAGQQTSGGVRSDATARERYRKQFEDEIASREGVTRVGDGSFTVNPLLGNSSYMSTPCFVNVVVKGPNVDLRTNELVEGQDFATRVLFDNYYVVFKVVNIIENGVFTQQMELWSHNVFGLNKLTEEQMSRATKRAGRG